MTSPIEILDIRRIKDSTTLESESTSASIPNLSSLLIEGLSKTPGERTIPPEVLYDTVGLGLYNYGIKNFWAQSGYYPIVAEKDILSTYREEIASELTRDSEGRAVIIELGAGSLEKTETLLVSLASHVPSSQTPLIKYYALDIDRPSILETLQELQSNSGSILHHKVATKGMWGTFEDAFSVLSNPSSIYSTLNISSSTPIHILFLGGTIGNFSKWQEDVTFLRSVHMNKERGDRWILSVDKVKDVGMMEKAYGEHGWPFMMNGLRVAGRALGNEELFEVNNWEMWSKYNKEKGRMEMGYKALVSHTLQIPNLAHEIKIEKDEVIMIMFSNKYTEEEINGILEQAKMDISKRWADRESKYWLFSLCSVQQ
ncbi:histidine-specific methyltransferase [Cyathus striatus]|nr:histidine-specific methyltransferase [Cyathus striatus]